MKSDYDHAFERWGRHYHVHPHLLKAQAHAESLLNPEAVSPAGAVGLAQFMAPTWRWAKTTSGLQEFAEANRYDPIASIALQAWYMRHLIDLFDGHVTHALAAYNYGSGNVRRHLRHHRGFRPDHLPVETERYIVRIFDTFATLARLGDH